MSLLISSVLSAVLACAIGGSLRALMRRSDRSAPPPPADAPSPPAFPGLPPAAFASLNRQGGFGEALTLVLMAAEGWRPLNGKPGPGPQGIDGIFWRGGDGGFEVRLVETKTNVSPYKPRSMHRDKLLDDLDRLFITASAAGLGDLYASIAKDLRAGAPTVTLQLWRHDLHRGVTRVTFLRHNGEKADAPEIRDSAAVMEALAAGVAEMDPAGEILKR